MSYSFGNRFITLVFVMFGRWMCILCDVWDDADQQRLVDDFIPEMYLGYRKALESSDEDTVSFRRVLRNNKEYNIHVHKLKDVNGLKRHNLIVKEKSSDQPLIYVSNPVETKIPNAYLSLEGFKELLTGRVLRQRNEFKETHPKKLTTLKHVNYVTKKKKKFVHFTKPRRKPIKKHTSNIKPKIRKSTARVKNTTANVPVINKHKKQKTKHTVNGYSPLKFTSKLVHKTNTVPKGVIDIMTTNNPALVNSVSFIIASTSQNNKSSSFTKKLPIRHYTLRTSASVPTETKKTIEVVTEKFKNVSISTEITANIVEMSKTEEYDYSRDLREKADIEETLLLTTETLGTEKTTVKESTSTESTTDKSTPEEKEEAPTSIIKESTTKNSITDETTKEMSTTENSTTEETTKETPTTEEITANKYFSGEITNTESNTDKSITEITNESSIQKFNTEDSTTEQTTTEKTTTEESTTKRRNKLRREVPTTKSKIKTKTKRSTLSRPLVFMGS